MNFSSLDSLEYPLVFVWQNADDTVLDPFWSAVSNIPLILGIFTVIIFVLWYRDHHLWRPMLFAFVVGIIMDYLVNEGFFKTLLVHEGVFRPRPWTDHPALLAIGHAFRDSSFPSSHMAFTTLMVTIVDHFAKGFLRYGIVIIILMGLSRVHNGMHYPTDVLMGIVMGLIYGYLALWLMHWLGLEKRSWWQRMKHKILD